MPYDAQIDLIINILYVTFSAIGAFSAIGTTVILANRETEQRNTR